MKDNVDIFMNIENLTNNEIDDDIIINLLKKGDSIRGMLFNGGLICDLSDTISIGDTVYYKIKNNPYVKSMKDIKNLMGKYILMKKLKNF